MPTCFSKGKVRWTVEKPMWLTRAIQTRLMREFFCLYETYGQRFQSAIQMGMFLN
ncbi:Uncharacterised protein [Neisseria meningitidis]|nr:hypothetical protein NMEN140_1676 [Neisseria meningitidis NM140]ELK57601.1 hypothetical protein NM98080_1735 [Neisseria meningitidis 98080]CWM60954.1 Uncharacterised protein [Neisseria meningitidis]CWO75727.1 Uncharacterised protein [Neisseria meningitidis]CWQ58820.1 Uncharacterised protein [Neisseria meningitidis]